MTPTPPPSPAPTPGESEAARLAKRVALIARLKVADCALRGLATGLMGAGWRAVGSQLASLADAAREAVEFLEGEGGR